MMKCLGAFFLVVLMQNLVSVDTIQDLIVKNHNTSLLLTFYPGYEAMNLISNGVDPIPCHTTKQWKNLRLDNSLIPLTLTVTMWFGYLIAV